MDKINDILIYLGLDVTALMAGFMGGLVSVLARVKRKEPLSILSKVIIVISGGVISNYTFQLGNLFFPQYEQISSFFGFCAGYGGIKLMDEFLKLVKSKIKKEND